MAMVALAETSCLRVLGTASTVPSGSHRRSSKNPSTCSVTFSPVRVNSPMFVDRENHVARASIGFSQASFNRATASAVVRGTVADLSATPTKPLELYTVGDFMTRTDELFCASPDTTVDEALEILVEKRITGLPVVDEQGKLVGVVSDYDLLALDSISGKRSNENSMFPAANSTWKAFKEIQVLLGKTQGKTVRELMSGTPLVVREMTNIEDAARILLETKFRRLPVVNEEGKLVGLLTRGNVVKAALIIKRKGDVAGA